MSWHLASRACHPERRLVLRESVAAISSVNDSSRDVKDETSIQLGDQRIGLRLEMQQCSPPPWLCTSRRLTRRVHRRSVADGRQ